MSKENVEIVRKGFEYWNRGDFEAFMDFSDDDQIIRTAEDWPERVVYGKDRCARSMRRFRRRWATTR
jgi:ketosteroid isomerase-like protein